MAIAIEQDQAVEQEQVIRVDIRKLAAAATLCKKVRPSVRHGSPWRDSVLVHGAYVYGGDALETYAQVPHGWQYVPEAFAVPYDTIVAAAKGRKGFAELTAGCLSFGDGATFAWRHDAETAAMMRDSLSPIDETEWQATYAADMFRVAVAKITPSASADETRPVLTGVYVTTTFSEWCATDSYRMAVATVFSGRHDDDGAAIIPAKALRVAASVKVADDYTITVSTPDSGVQYVELRAMASDPSDATRKRATTIIRTRVVQGQYPDYNKLTPDSFTLRVDCDGDALRYALKSAASVARKNAPIVLTADSCVDYVLVESGSGDDARGEWRVPCLYVGDTAEPFRFGVNAEYARDGAECVGGDVSLNLTDPLRPLLMTRTDAYQTNIVARYLVMPIRI